MDATMVEERLVEAADVLKRLPEVRVQGHYSLWPRGVHEFADIVGQEPPQLKRPFPRADAISRMDETLSWTSGLDPVDARIVWLRASGLRWKEICWKVGLARAAAHRHWLYALCAIACKLNGRRQPKHRGRQFVIEMVRGANP